MGIVLTFRDYSKKGIEIIELGYECTCINKMARREKMTAELDYAKLGARIKEARVAKGLTQEALAEMVNCNTSHVSNIENNHTKVSLNVLLAIANALDTSIDYLLSEQYKDTDCGVDNEITRVLSSFDTEWKQRILKIIKALS